MLRSLEGPVGEWIVVCSSSCRWISLLLWQLKVWAKWRVWEAALCSIFLRDWHQNRMFTGSLLLMLGRYLVPLVRPRFILCYRRCTEIWSKIIIWCTFHMFWSFETFPYKHLYFHGLLHGYMKLLLDFINGGPKRYTTCCWCEKNGGEKYVQLSVRCRVLSARAIKMWAVSWWFHFCSCVLKHFLFLIPPGGVLVHFG